ncbi:MAG TPA: hypothetical protein VMG12_19090 [Polyangiaceae bacterium]|nr:hypothetical protein [Polyangiaceae bacterium]
MQQTAKSAAPAAVEGAVEEAQKPDTRDDIARILADPGIRSAASALSSAIAAGVFDGLSDEQRTQQLQRMGDALVKSLGASMARSLRDDVGPQLSASVAEAIDRSIERALDAETEQRVEAMMRAATRGALTGAGESLMGPDGRLSPAWGQTLGQLARGVTQEAAFGVDDAVLRAQHDDGRAPALAALGTLSSFTQLLPLLLLGGIGMFLLLCALPVAWAIWQLRKVRRESSAHQEAALAMARAIKAAEPLPWSNELREHLARTTRDSAGAAELRQLLREHAELQLGPRERAPRSERSAYMG